MLSNPHGSHLQGRQRQHRRQISTPTALEAAKVPSLPAPALQRINAHRRGQSLDQMAFQMQPQRPPPMQDGSFPATNKTAPQSPTTQRHQPQSALREVQQQRLAQMLPHNSTSVPFMADYQALSQGDLHNSTENQANVAYMNPSLGAYGHAMEAQPMNTNLNLMQQQQQLLLRSQTFPGGNNAQMVDNCAWNMYQQDNLSTISQQPNTIPPDMRRVSVQSDVSPNSQRPHTPTHNDTRKAHSKMRLSSFWLMMLQVTSPSLPQRHRSRSQWVLFHTTRKYRHRLPRSRICLFPRPPMRRTCSALNPFKEWLGQLSLNRKLTCRLPPTQRHSKSMVLIQLTVNSRNPV